jgi:predicted HTH transcriptional regulator
MIRYLLLTVSTHSEALQRRVLPSRMRRCEAHRTAGAPQRETLEYKRDLSSLKCLVAFAKAGGGIIVIGVEDGLKNVRGVPDVLAAEEKLANLVSDSIRPHLVPDIEVVPWRNLNVLVLQVYPSNTRSHYLERLRPHDGVFIRVGSTNRKADALQIDELKRLNWMNSFDEQAVRTSSRKPSTSELLPSCLRLTGK